MGAPAVSDLCQVVTGEANGVFKLLAGEQLLALPETAAPLTDSVGHVTITQCPGTLHRPVCEN